MKTVSVIGLGMNERGAVFWGAICTTLCRPSVASSACMRRVSISMALMFST